MRILGLNAFHADAAACLLQDGKLVAAAEEERFRRVKHWAGFPTEAIRYCLAEAGMALEGVDHVAINQNPAANYWRKVAYAVRARPHPLLVLDRIRNRRRRAGVPDLLSASLPGNFRGRMHNVEHHVAHLSSAYHVSPFDEAAVVSVDGFGDFASAAWGIGRDGRIDVHGRILFPHSLGIFYQALTQYLGFPKYGDEYKIMGLAPYGEPSFLDEMRRIVRLTDNGAYRLETRYFRHHREKVDYQWNDTEPVVGPLYSPAMEQLLGPARDREQPLEQRHRDIAHSVQQVYEECFFHLLNTLHRRYKVDNLALSGGCAMNSVANGRVRRSTPFRRVYVQAAAGDAGGAIGAACSVWHRLKAGADRFRMDHAYWGPSFGQGYVQRMLETRRAELSSLSCQVESIGDEARLCRQTARLIADGKVVGWFQGRMEWGPRALGNRSIVCDPRRADMRDVLNTKIKRRESFRPFAPSILREHVRDWFAEDDDVPFMMKVLPVLADRRKLIPAVTHVDGSGRLQTVTRDANPRYYRLIDAFREITGVPIVLNTSFNENEPIVCTPEEALACFLRTEMDVIVLGDTMVRRAGT